MHKYAKTVSGRANVTQPFIKQKYRSRVEAKKDAVPLQYFLFGILGIQWSVPIFLKLVCCNRAAYFRFKLRKLWTKGYKIVITSQENYHTIIRQNVKKTLRKNHFGNNEFINRKLWERKLSSLLFSILQRLLDFHFSHMCPKQKQFF